ncbi:flagellar hook-associated protein FlgK [Thioclava pacifica]|nr:flagellar hook-associated protein FlgK [Thioclava pacifica]
MSISQSLSNALSGLNAASRMAEVVASNTSNALTEGYARREIRLGAQVLGGDGAGVRVLSVDRMVNESLRSDLRLADAAVGNASLRSDFLTQLEGWLGTPEDPNSLSQKLADFEATLIEASSRPDSNERLAAVLDSADAIATHLNTVSRSLQQSRISADQQIADQVAFLNESLAQIDELNATILSERASGHDANALLDQRQALVDQVSQIVPVRQVARENDQIALFTTGGAVLLEGNPAQIGFTPTGIITADMTQDTGALSGLTLNGMAISSADDRVMGGGTLGALFAIRDEIAPEAQSQIDAYARDLITRFSDPAVDPTLPLGAPGLFTENGGPLDPLNEIGLASRIKINGLADPAQGGALWRLRDGLGSTAPGPVGNSEQISALADALRQETLPASGDFGPSLRSSSGLAADMLSRVSSARQSAQSRETFASTRHETLNTMALSEGVDTDQEMQNLLRVEELYAANARVIQTVDALIQQLLEL